jgi:maltose/moltooligosaccharide transporter
LLWILDASVNISMEPFRAFVADLLPPAQRQLGFAMQSLLIGLGAVLSSALPWLLTHFNLVETGGAAGGIPRSVHVSFYVGAVVYISAVLYTIITTPEFPPETPLKSEKSAGKVATSFIAEIMAGIRQMPLVMRRLALVQFFTWLGLFCMWIYFTPAIARNVFHGTPGTAAYQSGLEWGGVCFATYNGVAFAVSILLVILARRGVPSRTMHRIGLICAGAGLCSVGVVQTPGLLLLSMIGVGIGWATILSMPYALLANAIPASKMGFYMGVFNFFIVLPQILAATLLGPIVEFALGGRAVLAVLFGGLCMLGAAAALSWVPDASETGPRD